jgi:methylmalonyl-CoA carboxyltransferase 12S subunit
MVERRAGSRKKADVTADLLQKIAELEERIARLESARDASVASLVATPRVAPPPPVVAPPKPAAPAPAPTPHEEVTEEMLLVISAAVAAFLGERAHIRQVRLLGSEAWAQQGRVSVMASHRWAVHR